MWNSRLSTNINDKKTTHDECEGKVASSLEEFLTHTHILGAKHNISNEGEEECSK